MRTKRNPLNAISKTVSAFELVTESQNARDNRIESSSFFVQLVCTFLKFKRDLTGRFLVKVFWLATDES